MSGTQQVQNGPINYFAKLAPVIGGVTATILLQQIIYWHGKMDRHFYKYRTPCDQSKPGQSWCEELGFAPGEFDGARRKIATKLRDGITIKDVFHIRTIPRIEPDEAPLDYFKRLQKTDLISKLVAYWTTADHRTYYAFNEPLFNLLFEFAYPSHVAVQDFPISKKWNQLIRILELESISEITTENTKEKDSSPTKTVGDNAPGDDNPYVMFCRGCGGYKTHSGLDCSVCDECMDEGVTGDSDGFHWKRYTHVSTMGILQCCVCKSIIGDTDNAGGEYYSRWLSDDKFTPLCPGCWVDTGGELPERSSPDSTMQNVHDDVLPKEQQLTETQYDMLRNMEDHGVGNGDHFAHKDGPRADILALLDMGYCKLLIDADEWVANDQGRAALKAYKQAQADSSKLTMQEVTDTIYGTRDKPIIPDELVGDDDEIGFGECPDCGLNISLDDMGHCYNCRTAKVGALCEVAEDEIPPTKPLDKFKIKAKIASVRHVKVSRPIGDDIGNDLIDEPIPAPKAKKARKAKVPSADTLMKNGLVAAMGHEQKDVTCWGEYQSTSKKLRTAKFPVEELPALYQFSCQVAARGNYTFKSPMQLAKDLPDYRKAQRQQAQRETHVDDSKPLDPTEGVIRSEL